MIRFIDRGKDLAFLEERYRQKDFECIVIYGRRRVGKTALIKEFASGKPHIYFLADKSGTTRNLLRFRREAAEAVKEQEIASEDIYKIFEWLIDKAPVRPVIIVDEFPYLIEKDDAIPSLFQRVIDELLVKKNMMLILCGSSMSMMESSVLAAKSPLYGRKTGHWRVLPLALNDVSDWFPKNPLEKNIEIFSVLGGMPFYLEKFSPAKSALENMNQEILSRTGRLYEEVDFLLREELREPDVYKAILEAIGAGKTKTVEIANSSGIRVHDLNRYLKVLMRLGLIARSAPVIEGPASKKSRYRLADPLFDFWFSFCEPHKSDLEIGSTENVIKKIEANFPSFVGHAFENVCAGLIEKMHPGKWKKIGTWWGAYRRGGQRLTAEIDLVGINEASSEILFAECKWKPNVDAASLLSELRKKAGLVDWHTDYRKESYMIVAKSFKKTIHEPNVVLIDLREIEKLLA